MIKLSEYDLISPSPYQMEGVGLIKAIRPIDIDTLPKKYDTYQDYIRTLMISVDDYVEYFGVTEDELASAKMEYEKLGLDFNVFDLNISSPSITSSLVLAFNFFLEEDVSYSPNESEFLIHNGTELNDDGEEIAVDVVGKITRDNYQDVADVILQRCAIKTAEDIEEEHPVFKNEKARLMWERQQKYLSQQRERESAKNAEFFRLGNVISALAYRSGLPIDVIWNTTLYNIHTQFSFYREGVNYDISALNYSVWGTDEKHKFDTDAWFKRKSPVAGDSDDLFNMAQSAKTR